MSDYNDRNIHGGNEPTPGSYQPNDIEHAPNGPDVDLPIDPGTTPHGIPHPSPQPNPEPDRYPTDPIPTEHPIEEPTEIPQQPQEV